MQPQWILMMPGAPGPDGIDELVVEPLLHVLHNLRFEPARIIHKRQGVLHDGVHDPLSGTVAARPEISLQSRHQFRGLLRSHAPMNPLRHGNLTRPGGRVRAESGFQAAGIPDQPQENRSANVNHPTTPPTRAPPERMNVVWRRCAAEGPESPAMMPSTIMPAMTPIIAPPTAHIARVPTEHPNGGGLTGARAWTGMYAGGRSASRCPCTGRLT